MTDFQSNVVHREVMPLQASAEQIRQFIMTPQRILDYYPSPLDGGILEAGRMIYCRGKSSVSLLELLEADSSPTKLVVKVTVANKLEPPYSKARIEHSPFFVMTEDWQIEEVEGGAVLTKTWRDLQQYKMRLLPMKFIVRASAKAESKKLTAAWNAAAAR